ncbi:MAG TPA: glycosyltransferase, partial [Lactococcus lactis]|nr:glycosyltransferase [Lactococcus lactis]
MTKILYMVVPCYNEELVLDETSERLKAKYEQLISNNIIS